MTFALSSNSTIPDLVQAINYLIGTQPGINSVAVNTQTGAIFNPYTQTNLGYTFQYLWAAYGTSNQGENFSLLPTNATYIGLRNSSDGTTVSTNPADYTWTQAATPFGTSNELYYTSIGGRQIQFDIAPISPSSAYLLMPIGGSVNLDIVTVSGTSSNTVFANTAFTVINNVQSNITQVGTLTRLSVTGNVSVSGNITGGNLTINNRIISSNSISASNNITSGNSISSANTIYSTYSITTGNFFYANSHLTAVSYIQTGNGIFSGNIQLAGNIRANGNATIGGFVVANGNIRGNIVKVGTQVSNWSIFKTPTDGLMFSFGGANLMVLNTDGNLIVAGNVIPNGTVI